MQIWSERQIEQWKRLAWSQRRKGNISSAVLQLLVSIAIILISSLYLMRSQITPIIIFWTFPCEMFPKNSREQGKSKKLPGFLEKACDFIKFSEIAENFQRLVYKNFTRSRFSREFPRLLDDNVSFNLARSFKMQFLKILRDYQGYLARWYAPWYMYFTVWLWYSPDTHCAARVHLVITWNSLN